MSNPGKSPTSRERFNRVMRFQDVDRLPLLFNSRWETTRVRWRNEGMTGDVERHERDGFDGPMQSCWLYGRNQGPIPAFEEKVLREDERYCDTQEYTGQKQRKLKDVTSMPHTYEYPIKTRKDWVAYKKRLQPDSPGRFPENWEQLVSERHTVRAGDVQAVAVWGFYGFPQTMFGPESLSLMFYDDPALIREMNEYWAYFTMERLKRVVEEMQFDYALIWEDNCYNHGMLHSPQIFREFMAPGYRLLVDFFRKHGIDVISVDSDGDVLELIPLLLDVGVTGLHPFEVAAGMDVVEIGKQYPELQMWGGINKRALAKDKKAIDEELQRVIVPMKERGGYAACLDHNVPDDVSYDNYQYYVQRAHELV